MRISIVKLLKDYLKNKSSTKLIDIVNGLYDCGLPKTPSSYMSVYIALRENEAYFERTSKGFYKLRNNRDCQTLLKAKLRGEELKNSIIELLVHKKHQTPIQIWRTLQKSGNYLSYKAVCAMLQNVDFSKTHSVATEKTYKSRYFLSQ